MNDKGIEVSKSFVPDEYSFDRMVLFLNEFKEYKNLHELREEGLIDRVSDLLINLNKWEPIHLPNVGDETIDSIVNGAIEKRKVATTTANSLLVRKHHNASQEVEILERQGYKLREKEDIEHMDKLETTIVKTNPGKKSKLSDKVKNMLNIPDAADTQQQTAISNSDVVTEAVPPTIEVVNSSIEVQTASKQTIKNANT